MRVLYQPATDPPADWQEVDVRRDVDWRRVIPSNLVALNVQGVVFEGHDHYAVAAVPGGVRVWQWSDDENDPNYLWSFGSVWDMLTTDFDPRLAGLVGDGSPVRGTTADVLARRLARHRYRAARLREARRTDVIPDEMWSRLQPEQQAAVTAKVAASAVYEDGSGRAVLMDEGLSGLDGPDLADLRQFSPDEREAITARAHEVNTRQSSVHYVAPEGLPTFGFDRYATPAEVAVGTGNVLPWADFPFPPSRQVAHGFYVSDIAAYDAARTPHGWREWVE